MKNTCGRIPRLLGPELFKNKTHHPILDTISLAYGNKAVTPGNEILSTEVMTSLTGGRFPDFGSGADILISRSD